MLTQHSRLLLVALPITLISAAPAPDRFRSITDLGDLGGGASVALAINERGQVAGVSLRAGGTTQGGFFWDNGVMTDLGSLGGTQTTAYAINKHGQVVGGSNRTGDASVGAFVWDGGEMIDLGGVNSLALGINDHGEVVGVVYAADLQSSSAFVWRRGVMTLLPKLAGGNQAIAAGINEKGQIVGQATNADGQARPVMWDDGQITDLGTLGGSVGVAYAINKRGVACGFSSLASEEQRATIFADGAILNLGTLGGTSSQCFLGATKQGQFVGTSTIAGDAERHAFVTTDDAMTDLNPMLPLNSGWLVEYAYGINDRGQIVGAGHKSGLAPTRAYLLSR